MLENMPIAQFMEWMAYLKIKAERENPKAGEHQETRNDPDVGLRLLGSLKGYQKQRDKLKAQGRLR